LATESGLNYYDTFCPISEVIPNSSQVKLTDIEAWVSLNGKKIQEIICPSEEQIIESIQKISSKMKLFSCDMILFSKYKINYKNLWRKQNLKLEISLIWVIKEISRFHLSYVLNGYLCSTIPRHASLIKNQLNFGINTCFSNFFYQII
jgi:hypothetical protein